MIDKKLIDMLRVGGEVDLKLAADRIEQLSKCIAIAREGLNDLSEEGGDIREVAVGTLFAMELELKEPEESEAK